MPGPAGFAMQPRKRFKPTYERKKIICARCGRVTGVRMKTPPDKPIYCLTCYRKVQERERAPTKMPDRICQQLDELHIWYKRFTHPPVFTSEEAAKVRGVPLESGVKAMVLKTARRVFVLALVPAHFRVDLKQIQKLEGARLKLAKPVEVLEQTGCAIGSVPPFGFEKPIKTYCDKRVFENQTVNFNIGDHSQSITMSGADLRTVLMKGDAEFF